MLVGAVLIALLCRATRAPMLPARARAFSGLPLSDFHKLALEGGAVKRRVRQGQEPAGTLQQELEDPIERLTLLGVDCRRRIFATPVGRDGCARPDWAHLTGSVVADGDDDIHDGCVGSGELFPTLLRSPSVW